MLKDLNDAVAYIEKRLTDEQCFQMKEKSK